MTEERNEATDKFVDQNLVAECHISLEKLTAKVQNFNAAKDNLLLAKSSKQSEEQADQKTVEAALKLLLLATEVTNDAQFEEKLWL